MESRILEVSKEFLAPVLKEACPTRTSQGNLAGTAHLGKLTLNSHSTRITRLTGPMGMDAFPFRASGKL